jgi:hypothetical protein
MYNIFTKEEMNILKLGFQCSIEKPITSNLLNIAIETTMYICRSKIYFNQTERREQIM